MLQDHEKMKQSLLVLALFGVLAGRAVYAQQICAGAEGKTVSSQSLQLYKASTHLWQEIGEHEQR